MTNKFLTLILIATTVLITSCSSDDNGGSSEEITTPASTGGIIDPDVGGFNQPNRVFVDLSTGNQVAVTRNAWEIAVYNGSENRVFINNTLLVSAAELDGITDITAVTETTVLTSPLTLNALDQTFTPTTVTVNTVAELIEGLPVNYYQYGDLDAGISFTDSKEGELSGTAFEEISTTDSENNVYIVNLGNEIPTTNSGTINTTGDARGYLKVRVLTDGNTYTIQYAALSNTTDYSELTVTKDSNYNLTYVSLTDEQVATLEPTSSNWDIDFGGVFSYYGLQGTLAAGLTYSDYTLHNTLGGVGLYEVTVEDDTTPSYTNFTYADVTEASFVYNDRAIIGSGWRSVDYITGETTVTEDRYYIVKDTDNNYYKLRFTAVESENGERGYPQFQYELLQ
ncbi:HmuY family protein [Lacinutrix sp. C3R15]|uniref:HmuY family protein n=1 Tax=Flavobacteriaceae TaxID=49546 RepID=UPI001C09A541|nr:MULTISPECIES: HmuY family protein [Flavobacteriaceae]MBU2940965.1 HmuY family protein [Lacinutrix sp. C3R15]MDO6624284.1 HmuY family protein [Oceanihabitans sp. 1_MG-2023]